MASLAIKGHATRGREVIELLEMLGGINRNEFLGDLYEEYYFINDNYVDWSTKRYIENDFIIFTLEEFLEKYPYKVGDKVSVYEYESKVRIDDMKWDGFEIQYSVFTDETEWYSAAELNKLNKCNKPYKEETMEKAEMLLGWVVESKGKRLIPHKDYEIKQDGEVFYLVKKKPQYPKSYEECAKILDCFGAAHIDGYKNELLEKLQELLICRDAYWKIVGDWKPNYKNPNKETFYFLFNSADRIEKGRAQYPINKVLIFPTEEMCIEFYENFKDLIEECKELL